LGYLVTRIDVAHVWTSMRVAPPAALVEALAVWMVGWWIVSYRLGLLMQAQGVPMGTFEAFEINLATLFYALFLPGGNLTGIAVRLYRLSRAGGRYATGLLAMASDRVAATAAITLVGLGCWALDPGDKPRMALAVLVVTAGAVIAAIAPFAVADHLRRAARLLRTRGLDWVYAGVRRTGLAFEAIAELPARRLALLLFLSCLSQVPGILAFVILARALGLSLSIVTLGWVRSVTLIVTSLPISVAGLGVREGLLLLLLRPYGVPDHDALAFSLLVFTVTIAGSGLVGGVLEAFRWLVPRASA
ncbi:MAG: flippase-like domain-containing protein, partial [Deltaproteobacteria bacterium]